MGIQIRLREKFNFLSLLVCYKLEKKVKNTSLILLFLKEEENCTRENFYLLNPSAKRERINFFSIKGRDIFLYMKRSLLSLFFSGWLRFEEEGRTKKK